MRKIINSKKLIIKKETILSKQMSKSTPNLFYIFPWRSWTDFFQIYFYKKMKSLINCPKNTLLKDIITSIYIKRNSIGTVPVCIYFLKNFWSENQFIGLFIQSKCRYLTPEVFHNQERKEVERWPNSCRSPADWTRPRSHRARAPPAAAPAWR